MSNEPENEEEEATDPAASLPPSSGGGPGRGAPGLAGSRLANLPPPGAAPAVERSGAGGLRTTISRLPPAPAPVPPAAPSPASESERPASPAPARPRPQPAPEPADEPRASFGLVPTRILVGALVLPTVFAALSVLEPSLYRAALGVDALIAFVAAIDALRCRSLAVTIRRVAPRVLSVGRSERVRLYVRVPTRRTARVEIHQTLFPGGEAEGLPVTVPVVAGAEAEATWRLTAKRRGRYPLGAHHVRLPSPWGLWQRQIDLPAEDEVQVWPDVKALSEYDLLARQDRQGLLTRTNRRAGNEAEFDRLRAYQHGDEYRLIDWKATARMPSLVVRQMRQPTDQNILFLVDCGRTMSAEAEGRPALDAALDAMLLVAHVALRQGDKVGLIAFDQRVRAWQPPKAGQRGRAALLRDACNLFPVLEEPDYREAFNLLNLRVRRRSLVVLFSNLVDNVTADTLATLFRSSDRHLIVWVCLRDPGVEDMVAARAGTPDAPWRRGAAAEVLLWRKSVLDRMARRGVLVVDASPSEFTPQLLQRYLEVKARSLL